MKCEICRIENTKLRVNDLYYHKTCLLESRKKRESSSKIEGGEDVIGRLDEDRLDLEIWQIKLRITLIFSLILGTIIGILVSFIANRPLNMFYLIPMFIGLSFALLFIVYILFIIFRYVHLR
ncbi:hypothetical protein LCGC14_0385840 [marine sediment metagenome]|uniref:Uncharacterized protein n=1 Tax=marine sediment metagenome TaxID=412755 RepID=A0A0F9VNA3_9ZZZZ|nr:MAG: hypothetical protein Lokiarch_33880 [Candidatus Lokiarchaeum sp. GC14_75]